MTTLVIDTGHSILGVYSANRERTSPVARTESLRRFERVKNAGEIVTYNGTFRDPEDLGRFAGIEGDLPTKGTHIDM